MLTGDEQMDAMVPILMDMVNATRELDGEKYGTLVGQAHRQLREYGLDEHMIGWFMFTIACSMIPYDTAPEDLLRWYAISTTRMEKWLAQGFTRTEAAYIINARVRDELAAEHGLRPREEGEG